MHALNVCVGVQPHVEFEEDFFRFPLLAGNLHPVYIFGKIATARTGGAQPEPRIVLGIRGHLDAEGRPLKVLRVLPLREDGVFEKGERDDAHALHAPGSVRGHGVLADVMHEAAPFFARRHGGQGKVSVAVGFRIAVRVRIKGPVGVEGRHVSEGRKRRGRGHPP